MRANIMSDTRVMDVMTHGSLRTWMKQHAGLVSLKMISEILLHLGELTVMRPLMV